jgi:hypothetical protein
MYISGPVHTAVLCSRTRQRQDRRDARGGKSGPLCATFLRECLEREKGDGACAKVGCGMVTCGAIVCAELACMMQ